MKPKLIISYFTFFFLLFTLLHSQNTWIKIYDPFNADTYVTEDVLICQDGGYVINGYYDIVVIAYS